MTQQDEWKRAWLAEERRAFQGWDFSALEGRWRDEALPWDYEAIVRKHLRPRDEILDMGTGGGEFLLSLGHPHSLTAVTEAWEPNIRLCRETLAPLGVTVYAVTDDARLPIAEHQFDMVLNRHEAYDLAEVARVLKPGGLFITQQVGGEDCASLAARLNGEGERPLYAGFSLEGELPKFAANGFAVQYADECRPLLRFFDVGAVVYFARIIEWTFPGFAVERNFERLCALQEALERDGEIATRQHRFVVVARHGA